MQRYTKVQNISKRYKKVQKRYKKVKIFICIFFQYLRYFNIHTHVFVGSTNNQSKTGLSSLRFFLKDDEIKQLKVSESIFSHV